MSRRWSSDAVSEPVALVWFKRDLRVRDHALLAQAQRFERSIALFVIEPEWLASLECDPRHAGARPRSGRRLRAALAAARERLYAPRHGDEARREADAIHARHGPRRIGLPPSGTPTRRGRTVPPGQGGLFRTAQAHALVSDSHA